MAYINNTAFEPRITNNRCEDLVNITGRYQEASADAVCSAGMLCVRVSQLPNEGYTGVYNENAWIMNAAADSVTANDVIYASNTYEWPMVSGNNGNIWAVGYSTLGLPIPEGRDGTFTRIDFNGENVYRFGVGNLSAALGSNTYFTIANGLLTPAASAPTDNGAIYFELRGTGNFTEGTRNSFGYVDVVAKTVVA